MGISCLWNGLVLALASALIAGCAFDNVGLLASRVTSAEGAWVVDVYSAGAYLHTRADDPGLQVGIGRRSYVFDKRDAQELTPGWHYFTAPLPERASFARDSRTLGLETTFARDDMSLTLGLRATTVMARVSAGDARFYRLTYLPEQPDETMLEIFEVTRGEVACLLCQQPAGLPSQLEQRWP
ncbi:MAG TPA: hypothetical protein VFE34_18745 [Dongiaceae bacterium]|nr:hypothetical protein [Dongiaceae bacterium]